MMWQRLKKLYADRKNLNNSLKWLMKISAPNKWNLLILILVNCILTAVGVATAAINKQIVDKAMDFSVVLPYIIVAVLFAAGSIAGSVFLNIFSVRLTEKYSFHIRCEMYRHILKSIWTKRTAFHSEGLLSRMTSDASAVTNGVISVSLEIITTIVQFVLAFFLLWFYDSSLAVVALLSGPVAAVVSVYMGAKLKNIQVHIQQSEADYRQYLQEHISHADVVKAFGQEDMSIDALAELQKKRYYWIKKKNRLTVYSGAVISFVFSFTYLFAFVSGAFDISKGIITYGTMTAFLGLMGQVQVPVMALSKLIPQFVGILASTGRIMEITEMEEEESFEECTLQKGSVGLKAENITLSYDGNVIIKDLSFDVKPGETVMLAGSSGIGKTTLLRGILGLLSPDCGNVVMYDGNGAEVKCSRDTRQYLSYVPQGNTLFSGTIKDNLKMGKADATDDEMWNVLDVACASDFIKELEKGLDTVVGERGCGLSEGQAQRISIARALLKPYDLLVLDEATSALDEATEAKILQNLSNSNDKTCLFVSHRETVGKYADRIIEIK